MTKKLIIVAMVSVMGLSSITGCSLLTKTCKEPGCEETEIYKDGYCKYHYEKHMLGDMVDEAEGALKDFINGN